MKQRKRFLTNSSTHEFQQLVAKSISFGQIGIGGIFHIRLIDAKTKEVVVERSIPNLMPDVMMNILGGISGSGYVWGRIMEQSTLALGSGSTPPDRADMALEGEFTRKSPTSVGSPTGYFTSSLGEVYHYASYRTVFLEGEGNGDIREIGIFSTYGAAPTFLVTRVLYKDELGNPDVLTKTSEQQLEIQYEHRVYPPMNSWSGTAIISDATYSYTASGLNIHNSFIWGRSFGSYVYGFLLGFGGWNGSGYPSAGPNGIQICPSASILINPTGSSQNFNGNSTTYTYIAGTDNIPYTASSAPADVFEKRMSWVINPSIANYGEIPGIIYSISLVGLTAANQTYAGHIQMIIDPPIAKTANDRLTIVAKVEWGRKVVEPE